MAQCKSRKSPAKPKKLPMDPLMEPIPKAEGDKFCAEMMKRLDSQRKNEQFCDVILQIGSSDDRAILKAHRIVLCAASPFFNNALNSDMIEREGVITLEETRKDVMEEVMEYMYTGHVDINEHNAFDLLAAADYFLIPSLKCPCSKFIEGTLSFSNCINAYYFGVKYQCAELQKGARDFILKNFADVSNSKDFLNLSSKQVEEWMSSDDIIVKGEEDVFVAILKWIESGTRRKQSFYDLFRHVRCVYVSRNYLVTVILQHRLVKDKKQCLDLVLDAMKESSDGTETCFLSQSPRNCLKTHEDTIFACGDDGVSCYLPSENKWYRMPSMRSKRSSSSLALTTCHGKLYVIGGNTSGFTAERYDPMLNSWTPVKSFKPHVRYASAVTFQGFLYVIGGLDNSDRRLSTVQRYIPDSNLWQDVPSLGCARSSLCAVADDNFMYAIGGIGTSGTSLDTVERFDPGENCWSRVEATNYHRHGACAVSLKGKIYVFGGLKTGQDGFPCEMYDPVANSWTELDNDFESISLASAACFKGKIFVFGKFQQFADPLRVLAMKVYDVDKNEWEPCPDVRLYLQVPGHYKLSTVRILKEMLDPRRRILSSSGGCLCKYNVLNFTLGL